MSGALLLTERQRVRLASLPAGHKVLSARYGALIVRRPDGQLLRVQPNGRLEALAAVRRVESYLRLGG